MIMTKMKNDSTFFTQAPLMLFLVYIALLNTPFLYSIFLQFLLLFLIILFSIISGLCKFSKYPKKGKIGKIYFVFFIVVLISVILSLVLQGFDFDYHKNTYIDLFTYFLFGLVLITIKIRKSNIRKIFRVLLVIGFIYSCSVYFQYFYNDVYNSIFLRLFDISDQVEILNLSRNGVYNGITNQTAHTAGIILFSIFIIISDYHVGKKILFSSLMFLFFLMFALLLTGKRAHIVFGLIAVIFLSIFSKKGIQRYKALFIWVIVILFLIASLYLFVNIFSNQTSGIFIVINNLYRTIFNDGSHDILSGREILYQQAVNNFFKSPIIGNGWRYFYNNSVGLLPGGGRSNVHNIYLQLLSDVGIIGFLSFLSLIVTIFNFSYRQFIKVHNDGFIKKIITFSLLIQTFYILYGFTGNGLSDYNYFAMYLLSVIFIIFTSKYLDKERNTV